MANPRAERDGRAKNEGSNTRICQTKHAGAWFGQSKGGEGAHTKDEGGNIRVLDLANTRVERVHPQRMRAATLGFAKPSIWVLDLANTRVERVHPQRMRAATLDLANARWAYKG